MYGWLWRSLPGPAWVRALTVAALVVVLVAVLFTWVFPAVAALAPVNDNTVGTGPLPPARAGGTMGA